MTVFSVRNFGFGSLHLKHKRNQKPTTINDNNKTNHQRKDRLLLTNPIALSIKNNCFIDSPLLAYRINVKLEFFSDILKDETIINFKTHCDAIYKDIINTINVTKLLQFEKVGICPLLVCISLGHIDLVYHLYPG